MTDNKKYEPSNILQRVNTDSSIEHKSPKYNEGIIKKLKQELAEKNMIIKELTARLDVSMDRDSEVNQSLTKQSNPISVR